MFKGVAQPFRSGSSVTSSTAINGSMPQSPCRYQSSPIISAGCIVLSEPLPHARELAGQYLSQPQQMRSGCLGLIGKFLAMSIPGLPLGCASNLHCSRKGGLDTDQGTASPSIL